MAKTGSVTIKGRNGTSASGKTVSVYSPQYSATTGQDAPDRGTTSAAVQLSDEFTEEQKEAAKIRASHIRRSKLRLQLRKLRSRPQHSAKLRPWLKKRRSETL